MKALLVILVAANCLAAPVGTIVQFAHRIKMSATEAAPARDFYVDIGQKNGLTEGETLQVFRHVPITNAMSGQPSNIVKIILGEATVIRANDFVSLLRLKKLADPAGLPATNYYQFMLGDLVSTLKNP